MPNAVHETRAVAVTACAKRYHPPPPSNIVAEDPEWACSAPEESACDSEPRCHETQTELAHANRVAILGQLAASIAHEVKQPILATVIGAQAALRWLERQPPDLEEARQVLARIVQDGIRTTDIVDRIRALTTRSAERSTKVRPVE
jgi:C4-dicarboxylate-specific signal transduction histidine kinase